MNTLPPSVPYEFGLESWSSIAQRLFCPDRPHLQAMLERGTQFGSAVVLDAKARGLPTATRSQRASILQSPAHVQELWEDLAPPPWVGHVRRTFRGPNDLATVTRPSPPGSATWGATWAQDWDVPCRAEDVIALTSDPAGVERCEALALEAGARGAQFGLGPVTRFSWWSVPDRCVTPLFNVLQWQTFLGWVIGTADADFDMSLPPSRQFVERAIGPSHLLHRGSPTLPLRVARHTIQNAETWARFARRGGRVSPSAPPRTRALTSTHRAPIDTFANPFMPLIHILLAGYVLADITDGVASLLFPRLMPKTLSKSRSA